MAGNAWCLNDDLAAALALRPGAPVIAVNGAAGQVRAFALFSQHPLKLPRWIAMQKSRFGAGFTVHAAGKAHMATKLGRVPAMPWVDHWWQGVAAGGTSAWGARRLARAMGFSEVILCGAPLDPGGYADKSPAKQMRRIDVIQHYRSMVARDEAMHEGCYSMSGWTRGLLGAPA